MQIHPATGNCGKHPWQPMLGVCVRCGDFLCVRCGTQRDQGLVCEPCSERLSEVGQELPYDRKGPWLASIRDTVVLLLRSPYEAFSRLADGAVGPAWKFATWCTVLVTVLASLARGSRPRGVLLMALVAGVEAGLFLLLEGGLLFLGVRAMRGRISWSLALRCAGYTSAWHFVSFAPFVVAQLILAPGPRWLLNLGGLAVMWGATGYACYALARGRAQLPKKRALIAAGITLLPSLALHLIVTLGRG